MDNLINKSTRALFLIGGLATVAACAPESGVGQFYREAGAQLDQGEFGNASLHNQLVQTCRTNGFGSGKVGAAEADPLVVLDPESTQTRKVYRVHCDGTLDGKYAAIIYREYVGSAVQPTTVEDADAGGG
ncbi:hypothetical protein [Roseobacter weihaiensis]|uniref:hypothetical protein n=1 Tax=Roseobacter weihaiensis TaxID=2763262 RepID=UPI001D0B12BB|nr:hypothetical protein [Roseobacter sp. H9]